MKRADKLLLISGVLAVISFGFLLRFESQGLGQTINLFSQDELMGVSLEEDWQVPSMAAEEDHAEYDGSFVVEGGWGAQQASAQACKAACLLSSACNVWVWCARRQGCSDRTFGECWLKHHSDLNPLMPAGRRHASIAFTSGAKYSLKTLYAAKAAEAKRKQEEADRLARLTANTSLPLVFFDVAIKGEKIGRIEMALFIDHSPRAAENFRALCTGEKGIVPAGREGAGKAYHFKGAWFYRIIDRFIDQAGANTESVFGGQFADDAGGLQLRHDRRGLLSMANMGPDTNTSHFSIMLGPAPHLDGKYTIFGEVVKGFEVVQQVNALAQGMPDNTAGVDAGAQIVMSGQLH